MGDIGHHSNVKLAACHPMLCQTMRGGFKHHMSQPRLDHFCEQFLNFGSLRCGDMKTCVNHFITDDSVDS